MFGPFVASNHGTEPGCQVDLLCSLINLPAWTKVSAQKLSFLQHQDPKRSFFFSPLWRNAVSVSIGAKSILWRNGCKKQGGAAAKLQYHFFLFLIDLVKIIIADCVTLAGWMENSTVWRLARFRTGLLH